MYSLFWPIYLDHVTRYSNGHTVVATNKTPLAKRRQTQRFLRSSARTHALATLIDLISFALRTGQGQQCTLALLRLTVVSIQLQTTLTDICGVLKQEKSIQTSNKKHFMKNVKECRDVIVKKVLEQGWDTRTTQYTHVGPMTPYIVV